MRAWWRRRAKAPPPEAQTPFGRFVRDEIAGDWDFVGDAPVGISATDRDGAPDPAFVARLPELLADLARWEGLAREAFDFEEAAEPWGGPFALNGLSQGRDGQEFVLAFGPEADATNPDCSVFVAFAEVAWSTPSWWTERRRGLC